MVTIKMTSARTAEILVVEIAEKTFISSRDRILAVNLRSSKKEKIVEKQLRIVCPGLSLGTISCLLGRWEEEETTIDSKVLSQYILQLIQVLSLISLHH